MSGTELAALIVDDEPIARQVVAEHLEGISGLRLAGEAGTGEQAFELIEQLRPDIVFLDIQLPEMTGFDVIRNLGEGRKPIFVLVTAYDQHAIRAFEAGAVDYLLKPVRRERLLQAVERARQRAGNQKLASEFERSVLRADPAGEFGGMGKIVGRSGHNYILLPPEKVIAVQAEGELVWILTKERRYLSTMTLGALEQRLSRQGFRRVHRSTLVNLSHISRMSRLSSQRWMLTLTNEQEVTVSKRKASAIRGILRW